jgi:glycosyltransferase involved in cell wall biosynthesis
MTAKLSAVLCVHNEEARLADCLEKLDFADELVVVLDRCTDGSRTIAEWFGARIIEGAFELEGPRRNAAIDAAAGDWIVEVDADEHFPPQLGDEIRQAIESPTGDWYVIRLDNYVGKRLIRYGWGSGVGTTQVARLFRKGGKRWGNQRVHPNITLAGQKGGILDTPYAHYLDADIADLVSRINRYTTLRARDLRDHWREIGHVDETLRHNLARIFGRFYKCYWRRQGYREGKWGVLLALMSGLYPILSYFKAVLEDE